MDVKASAALGSLRQQRLTAGLSQQRVAELAKCSLSMVRLIENGYVPRESEVLRHVVEALEAASPQNDDDSAATESFVHHTPTIGAPDRGSG